MWSVGRIGADGDTVSDTARVWRQAMEDTQRSLGPELAAAGVPDSAAAQVPVLQSPSAAVAASAVEVERLLHELLAGSAAGDVRGLPMPQLAIRALQFGLIDAQLADSVTGLGVMRILAAMEQDRLTERRAAEFTSLATGIAYLLQMALRRRAAPAMTGKGA
jgi:hypothetical protein